ncbi:MAG: hypothetical protein A2008_00115 [Candidatus Wallbacteria bacterium GWC2_49_35]|uniref:Uncharacterized protein n=1 Tax=Candidatus Wallbacteria bacterium GWC2_49_35 TaxID=1817813 RepID=A0A1F7WWR0_9BACT|nr:MAG: hypothetical protein A2008_00115 [Candidatus Wallbacteria bacterium GWC2_49_35]HBC73655.1 hypothetical protein [Candidatus Wallbacteria bacterium]
MNSRSTIYLQEAVSSIQKGHLTIEAASEKYGIPADEIKVAIKNYCLYGKLSESGPGIFGGVSRLLSSVTLKNLFGGIAPTYDCEKEIDRFKFKFTYAAASFLLVALGVAAMSFPTYLSPADSTAKPAFEEKLDRTLATASRPGKTVDAEVKYLNNFYSRINKILEESDSKDSKMLKAEVKKRLKYINSIETDDIARKAADISGTEPACSASRANEIYSNLYEAACEKDKTNYMARTLKERIDKNYLISRSKYSKKSENPPAENSISSAGEEAKSPAAAVTKKAAYQAVKIKNAAVDTQAPKSVKPEAVKSYKYNRTQAKNFESLKDKLYIINKYKHDNMLKKAVAKKELKFKYPVAEMILVPDRTKYNDSLKKIATNKDYNSRSVMITEDRG